MGLDVVILVLLVVVVVLLMYLIATRNKGNQSTTTLDKRDKEEVINAFNRNVMMIAGTLQSSVDNLSKEVKTLLANMTEKLSENKVSTERNMLQIQGSINTSLEQTRKSLTESLELIRQTLERNVKEMQQSNQAKLDQIQQTVDEKLTKTLNDRFNESFKVLAGELEKVTKTIGEMQKISSEVGTLSKMLSNVKTTGIFGEIQLGAIIDEILSPEQYDKNVVTNKASRDPVEYVVKLPGGDDGEVLLPIDSKFPYTIYSEMQSAYDQNDFAGFESKKKQLVQTVKGMAKDIHDKYICPPRTTNFAVMFLPVEGLYAEVVKLGLVEELRTKYSVTVAGPTTMAALLNSLQMGFQTLAIQKKSNEVWSILGAVKTEFGKFGAIIEGIQKKLNGASNDLDTLLGVRTRAIDRSLRNVTASAESSKLLGIADDVVAEE